MDSVYLSLALTFGISLPIAVGAFIGLWRKQKKQDQNGRKINKEAV